MDWIAHLEHLQTVLKKFDLATALNKDILIYHFCNGLKSFIWVQFNKQSENLDTWEKFIKKAINGKGKIVC